MNKNNNISYNMKEISFKTFRSERLNELYNLCGSKREYNNALIKQDPKLVNFRGSKYYIIFKEDQSYPLPAYSKGNISHYSYWEIYDGNKYYTIKVDKNNLKIYKKYDNPKRFNIFLNKIFPIQPSDEIIEIIKESYEPDTFLNTKIMKHFILSLNLQTDAIVNRIINT